MAKGKHIAPSAKRKSKKSLALIIALALVLTAAIGGTIAYLIDKTTEVVNVFEPTDVSCRVVETLDGSQKTNVSIMNTGTIDAYLRATMVANWVTADGHVCANHAEQPSLPAVDTTVWVHQGNGIYLYPAKVAPKACTENLFDSYPLGTAEDGCTVQLEIMGSAIQADPSNVVTDNWDYNPSTGSGS